MLIFPALLQNYILVFYYYNPQTEKIYSKVIQILTHLMLLNCYSPMLRQNLNRPLKYILDLFFSAPAKIRSITGKIFGGGFGWTWPIKRPLHTHATKLVMLLGSKLVHGITNRACNILKGDSNFDTPNTISLYYICWIKIWITLYALHTGWNHLHL